MRKILGILGTTAVAAAALVATAAPAQAAGADSCTLIQTEIYNGANIIQWVQGLEGCSGDVYWEVQSGTWDGSSWTVWDSGTTHYDNNTTTVRGDVEFPCMMRVYAEFGGQTKTTRGVINNNCGGGG
ncbi:MAG TPA: hypothetical protein VGF17_10790 [Phytomonospora sp.]